MLVKHGRHNFPRVFLTDLMQRDLFGALAPLNSPRTIAPDVLSEKVQKCSSKIDACITVPRPQSLSLDKCGNVQGFPLFETLQMAVYGAESNDDFGDTEQEGLGPEAAHFAFKFTGCAMVAGAKAGRGLQFDIGDRVVRVVWFAALHGVYFASDHDGVVADACAYYRAVLGIIVDDLVLAVFDFLS